MLVNGCINFSPWFALYILTVGHVMKLTKKQLTQAIAQYARRHNYYARTVRAVSCLFYQAIAEYKEKKGVN